ncbi:MAG TPA: zf-HC2 domain-containing protein [Acidimicrobiales bacterium]|nr:zf-HC2 domain-containing protein [Acidimicrobiales bacterium]
MGIMTAAECERWRGLQAMHAIGRLEPHEESQLRAHLEGCPACQAETVELAGIEAALGLVDLGHLDDGIEPAIPLESARWERVRWERKRRVRMTATRWAMAGMAAAAVAAIALVVVSVQQSPAPTKTVALRGTPGVQASVVLTAKAWGTQATFEESGQKAGQVWTVTMETSPGSWWVAGSYRTLGSDGQVQVTLSCAVPADQITHVWVNDGAGHTVLRGYVQ